MNFPLFASATGGEAQSIDLDEVFADCFFTFDGQFTDNPAQLPPGAELPPPIHLEQKPVIGAGGGISAAGAAAAAAAVAAVEAAAAAPVGGSSTAASHYGGNGSTNGRGNVLALPEIAETRKRKLQPLPAMPNTDKMSEKQKIERRQERNREHAKRSRIRKKFLLECLQEQLLLLRKENMNLRTLIKERMPDAATKVFEKCINERALVLSGVQDEDLGSEHRRGGGSAPQRRLLVEPDFQLIQSLMESQQNFTVSDPSLPDNPIVYASQGFLQLTGYTMDKVIGRNCRFLQGPGTDPRAVDIIRRGVAEGRDTSVCLLNYRADGQPFWNQFFVAALRDASGKIVNHVGVQCGVKELTLEEYSHRLKKLPVPEELMNDGGDDGDEND